MKTFFRGGLFLAIAAILTFSPFASASAMDDLSWFGNTGATAGPVKDADYSGYWWWPTVPASNNSDQELWGNRGVVYNMYKVTPPPAPEVPKAPVAQAPAPAAARQVPVANSILFDFDSAVLKPEGQKEVARVADIMKKNAGDTVTVEGHTCDLGSDEYNQALGKRRADSVMKALTGGGVEATRVASVSKGEKAPAVANDSEANRSKNRRVVFLFKIK
jgi:outer membrane protein OmpA-like peptidoglycan-associated protein